MKTDIAIIGGGLAGLALAHHLHNAGRDYQLFEARPRLGGRIKALQDGDAAFDLGPSWFWPGQPRMAALSDQLGLTVFDQYATGALSFEDETGGVQRNAGWASMEGSRRIAGGMQAMVDRLAQTLDPARIHLGRPMQEVGRTHLTLANGTQISAAQTVITLPPRVAATLLYTPALAPEQTQALQDIPTWMGGQAKCVATYDTPFWREAGLSGDAMSRRGPMVEIHDASAPDGPFALFGFIGLPASARATHRDILVQACIDQLTRLFGAQAATPRQAVVQDWANSAHTSTAADHIGPSHHPAYGLPPALAALRGGTLHFGSTETAPEFGGYLEGALARAEQLAGQLA